MDGIIGFWHRQVHQPGVGEGVGAGVGLGVGAGVGAAAKGQINRQLHIDSCLNLSRDAKSMYACMLLLARML